MSASGSPTIDAFTFVGESLFGYGQSATELLARLDAVDIDGAIVCPVRPRDYHLAPANDLVAEATAGQARLVGLARVDPNRGEEALDELDRALHTLHLRGLFLHPWEDHFRVNGSRVTALMQRCATLRAPVVIATGYPWLAEAAQVGEVARRFPDVRIVMTHGGQINISGLGQADAFEVLRRHPNVSIETSGVYRQDFLEDVATTLGAERVLFGSNSPLMDVRLEVERARWARLPDAARQLVLGGNAQRIFKLGSSAPPS